jgi:eukaryotic-like serine/threonine-protein kinase
MRERTISRTIRDVDEDVNLAGPPQPGSRVGQYELIRELGRGGMGAVFLARDTKLGRRAAIKFLHSEQPEVTARFILEARATARCNHENIVIIYEVGEHEGNPYMVLEHLQGAPLSKLLGKGRRLSPARAIELMVPVVRALACAHAHNIVHRDLKPDNIFVTDAGTIKVLDFGIAKLVHEQQQAEVRAASLAPGELDGLKSAHVTRRGALVGTLPYMSPEQWGAGAVDHRTDIWAVGIMLFRMITGQHPLGSSQGMQFMVTGMVEEPMPAVHDRFPDVPDELARVIDHCLIKDKEQRVGSAQELLEALEPLLPGFHTRALRVHERPYAGLSAFQEADANRFFGRAQEIAAAVTRLRDQPLLGVIGPSGVGKSSFVRAGVVPALKHSGEPWSAIVLRPGRQPVDALAHVASSMIRRTSNTVAGDLSEHQAMVERLYQEPGYLGTVLRSHARHKQINILIFVDQFEELYTLVDDPRERRAFTACLASVADDATTPLRVILSLRSDFLDRVPEDPQFMAELSRGLFFLTPPGREGLRDALIQPAEMAGYQFETPAMVEEMLDHLEHTPGALPLLQFAASKLWDMRDRELRRLSGDSYRAIGGIAGALASHADAVLAGFPARSRELLRALFLRLVTPEQTRAVVSVSDLQELSREPGEPREIDQLVAQLVEARLLVVHASDREGGASVEIVHESLIESWPLLRRWLDDNHDDAVFLEQLRTAAKQWHARGRPSGLLWRGEAMEEARRWRRRYRGELPASQQAYLDAVLSLATRSARLKRFLIAATMALLSLMVAAAAVALVLISDAQKEATRQARAAQGAEEQVREQLERVQAEVRARLEAEAELKAALAELQRAKDDVERAKDDVEQARDGLEDKNVELAGALKRARRDRRRARTAREEALTSADVARQAEGEAQLAVEELKVRLVQAQARVDALQVKVTNMIQDVRLDEQPRTRSEE